MTHGPRKKKRRESRGVFRKVGAGSGLVAVVAKPVAVIFVAGLGPCGGEVADQAELHERGRAILAASGLLRLEHVDSGHVRSFAGLGSVMTITLEL